MVICYYLCFEGKKVGTTAANWDRKIGKLIAKAMEKVGKDGPIVILVSCLFNSLNPFLFYLL